MRFQPTFKGFIVKVVEATIDIQEHGASFHASHLCFLDPMFKEYARVECYPLGEAACLSDRIQAILYRNFYESLVNDSFSYFGEGLHQGDNPVTRECVVIVTHT